MMNKLKTVYNILCRSVKNVLIDYSYLTLITIVICVNFASFLHYDAIFTENLRHSFKEPIFLSGLSFSLILMVYGGYLGNKFFTKEIEENRLSSLLMIPDGKTPVYFGKVLGGSLILASLTLFSFLNIYISIHYWGSISYLTISRIYTYLFSAFTASLFVFFMSIIIGLSTKKSIGSMLFTTVYVVLSFFLAQLVQFPEKGVNIYTTVMVIPFLNIRYSSLFIEEFGELPSLFLYVPIISIIWALIVSYILFRGVKI